MRTVIGWLGSTVIQRQVRRSLRQQDHQRPGNPGPTATPTAAGVLALWTPVTMGHCQRGKRTCFTSLGDRTITGWSATPWELTVRGLRPPQCLTRVRRALHSLER